MPNDPIARHDPDASFAAARADARANEPSPRPPAETPPASDPANPARNAGDVERARAFAIEAARICRDDKCEDVVLLDVRGLSQITDFLVIASGTSDRQMRSVLNHIEDLGKDRKFPVVRSSADDRGTWLLADFVDVVVHLFEPNTRAHYDLEMLWGDAGRMNWQREGAQRDPPGRPRTVGADPADTPPSTTSTSRDYAGLHATPSPEPPSPREGQPQEPGPRGPEAHDRDRA